MTAGGPISFERHVTSLFDSVGLGAFERQVARALWAGGGMKLGPFEAIELAPRVAAAIQVAARDFGQDIASAEQAALGALRGETP